MRFKNVVLLLIKQRMNLLTCESVQHFMHDTGAEQFDLSTENGEFHFFWHIVCELAEGSIKSPHLSQKEAKNLKELVEELSDGIHDHYLENNSSYRELDKEELK